jgi:hypothetical protein
MKNASRRRPQVEPLESMMLMSTLVAGPHGVASITLLPKGSTQVSPSGKVQPAAHTGKATLTVDRSLPSGQSGKLGTASTRVVLTTVRPSTPAPSPATARPQVTTAIDPGPTFVGNTHLNVNTLHAMIIPADSRPIIVTTQVTSPVAPPQTPLAKAEALFSAEHPALGA